MSFFCVHSSSSSSCLIQYIYMTCLYADSDNTRQIVENCLFVNYKFENVKFINMIRKKNKDNEDFN